MTRLELIKKLKEGGTLVTNEVIAAFENIDRVHFVLPEFQEMAYEDSALSIGFRQTISQPFVVAFMLELLQAQKGDRVLEVGSGSGWQTALLAHIVGGYGKVVAVERVERLAKMTAENAERYGYVSQGVVRVVYGDGTRGYEKCAPYNRIIAAASGREIPKVWFDQLVEGGRLVTPINESVHVYEKDGSDALRYCEFPGFKFVPLVTNL